MTSLYHWLGLYAASMLPLDLDYLRRIAAGNPVSLLKERKFLEAQKLFFEVVTDLHGTVDFDVADMREVHAIAALGDEAKGLNVLDIGCGSTEAYVLGDNFRDLYPPFFAEMLVKRGAKVTGIDIRPQKNVGYDHRVLDLTKPDWTKALDAPHDVVACFNVFNAPKSPFEHDVSLCDRIMDDMYALLAPDGLLIVTLRDDLRNDQMKTYLSSKNFELMHRDGNTIWAKPIKN